MEILRLVLFLGLIVHKLLWELMKRTVHVQATSSRPTLGWSKRLVKAAKIGALAGLVVQTLFLNLLPISNEPAPFRIGGMVVYLVGLTTAVLGRLQLGSNWANIEDTRALPNRELVSHGIYRFVRHPIYVGDFLLLVGLELTLNSWLALLSVVPLAVIVRQALAEESQLAKSFRGYEAYRARTKMFIPFVV